MFGKKDYLYIYFEKMIKDIEIIYYNRRHHHV